jgi:hypothetical protein
MAKSKKKVDKKLAVDLLLPVNPRSEISKNGKKIQIICEIKAIHTALASCIERLERYLETE